MNIQKNIQQGFTLIELMIVIAIVGILAAIALPAYQDYVVRAKMSEPAAALAEAKTSLSEYYSANNYFPADDDVGGISNNPNKLIVASLFYDFISSSEAIITASIQPGVIPGSAGGIPGFSLSSITRPDGSILWICSRTKRNAQATEEIPAKFLPSNCRT